MVEDKVKRASNPQLEAERSARALVAELRTSISRWNDELARYRATATLKTRHARPIQQLALELKNAQRRLATEMQGKPIAIRGSAAVRNCRLAIQRALTMTKELSGK